MWFGYILAKLLILQKFFMKNTAPEVNPPKRSITHDKETFTTAVPLVVILVYIRYISIIEFWKTENSKEDKVSRPWSSYSRATSGYIFV